jgi:carboxyl-terminal processing protease
MRDGTYPNFPLAVLVNGSSASAAEILAGALRDNKRAVVVGERTYGKGSVQEVVELDRQSGAIKLTTAYYYLPNGQCIHRTPKSIEEDTWGVKPTIPVNLTESQRAKWVSAWRELGRERTAATQPASAPASRAVTSEPSEDVQRAAAARALYDADLQLDKAVEYLQTVIQKPDGNDTAPTISPATTKPIGKEPNEPAAKSS